METWEEMIKHLPSDETLERLEKNGTLEKFDKDLDELGKRNQEINEQFEKNKIEIDKMLNENNIKEESTNKTK